MSKFGVARSNFHRMMFNNNLVSFTSGTDDKYGPVYPNADKSNKASVLIAAGIAERILPSLGEVPQKIAHKQKGQTAGTLFEEACNRFITECFLELSHIRPGNWDIQKLGSRKDVPLGAYEQYAHLVKLNDFAKEHVELKNFLGDGYTIAPDVVVLRYPEPDDVINLGKPDLIVDSTNCQHSMLRASNHVGTVSPLLHASVSCKFTMRSDRAQNARTEALNLMRSRKGRVPHIVVVTAEPTPSRLSSIALGTGDIDCVYHFALYELINTLTDLSKQEPLFTEQLNSIMSMVEGKRLKDISDLPLDLAI
ncbi:type II restriction endonuclease NgoMIV [Shewanella carassii]|uniref:NgoMIV family type II restriction endonuclease n=1 Tax=Shewanella TaxID=22 RepID=UPI00138F1F72|nr:MULTISPECIES: NgoMIV family type II restriction endonuclease [Shewanella]NDO75993.1 restriction endonuclease [Shewanella sp. SE1]BCV67130.1 type II restriction endonuclease NgoMIV [Shewanella carassii]